MNLQTEQKKYRIELTKGQKNIIEHKNKMLQEILQFALDNNFFETDDYNFIKNRLLDLLKIENVEEKVQNIIVEKKISEILEPILNYAVEKGIITNSISAKDKLDAEIMGLLISRPSEIIKKFYDIVSQEGIKSATDWYYDFSQKTNYIKTERIAKNISWEAHTEFGNIQLTINLSKPEKDPKEIAEAKKHKSSGYPKCILCAENEGYSGDAKLPARQNHRIIPVIISDEKWFLQYSPYSYFNEHCIVLSEVHRPMKIDKQTFIRLLNFVEQFPHYFIGSNADLPIVGGSILSHDHFQGGRHEFPMAVASNDWILHEKDLQVGIVDWPMSVIRLKSENVDLLVEKADIILKKWQNYSNSKLHILAKTSEPHNTITPIARYRNEKFELDLVLRNNRTTEDLPLGIFHPHNDLHHIKKENIGLIEVMGLAILPGRLLYELNLIEQNFQKNTEEICNSYPELEKHKNWIDELYEKFKNIPKEVIPDMLREQIGNKFSLVLEDSGIFKRDKEGKKAFFDFLNSCFA